MNIKLICANGNYWLYKMTFKKTTKYLIVYDDLVIRSYIYFRSAIKYLFKVV